jgi:hypothetical protein
METRKKRHCPAHNGAYLIRAQSATGKTLSALFLPIIVNIQDYLRLKIGRDTLLCAASRNKQFEM